MSMIGFPLLLIPLAIYNIIVFLMPGVSFADPLAKIMLVSGAEWPLTLSDILLSLSVLLLLSEVIKGARPGAKYLTDHLLSLIVFVAAAAEFVLWPKFGTSTFFLLTLLALVDFLSGIALRTRRGALAASGPAVSRRGQREADAAAPEPRSEPAPVVVPAAPAAVEAAPRDRAEPAAADPEVTPQAPSPEVPSAQVPSAEVPSPEVRSPGLQPGDDAQPSPDTRR